MILNNLGNNIYHTGTSLSGLLKSLDYFINTSIIDENDYLINNLTPEINDFFNSYSIDKELLNTLLNQAISKATNEELIFTLKSLKYFYDYYTDYLALQKYNTIENLYKLTDINSEINFKCDKINLYYPFDLYNKCNINKKEIKEYVKNLPDSDEKTLYEEFLKNKNIEINFYYLTKESEKYRDLLQNYFNSKTTFYNFLNTKLNLANELKEYTKEILKLQSQLDLSKLDKKINFYSNLFINTFSKFGKYSSTLYDRDKYYTSFQESVNNITELSSSLLYLDEQETNRIIIYIKTLKSEELTKELDDFNSLLEIETNTLNSIKSEIEKNKDITQEQYSKLNNSYKTLSSSYGKMKNIADELKNNANEIQSKLIALQNKEKQILMFGAITSSIILAFKNDLKKFIESAKNKLNNINNLLFGSKEKIQNLLIGLGTIVGVISFINNPRKTIGSLLNLLVTPFEAILAVINTIICSIKSVLCFIASIVKTVEKAINAVTTFIDKLKRKRNSLNDLNEKIKHIKEELKEKFENTYENNIKGYQSYLVNSLYGSVFQKLDKDKAKQFAETASKKFQEYFENKKQEISDIIHQEVDRVIENLKESAENTVNNIINMLDTSNCKPFDIGLSTPTFNFEITDISLNIPYFSSKNIKCY